ncbi:MAG: DUF192 domain-containing protein [Chitinophagales bacterium]
MDIDLRTGFEINEARTFWKRFLGLMGQPPKPDQALLIKPCSSVHTFFMRFPIDIIFLDSGNQVLKVIDGLKPWRMTSWVRNSEVVVELPAGAALEIGIQPGDIIRLL